MSTPAIDWRFDLVRVRGQTDDGYQIEVSFSSQSKRFAVHVVYPDGEGAGSTEVDAFDLAQQRVADIISDHRAWRARKREVSAVNRR